VALVVVVVVVIDTNEPPSHCLVQNLSAEERLQYSNDYPEEADTMSRFAERFREEGLHQGIQQGMQQGIQQGIQEGMQQGLQQGIQQGLQQGEARLLARQLQLKFGTLPPDVLQRLAEADEPTLLAWSERLLTANRLEDVLH
jgi:flagellar biosynthesis/type III secretory pathway protein FliH